MQSEEIRKRFIDFFKERGHAEIPSASLVPENDPSVLFTTAGMQPLAPYLLGQKHPMGKRLVNIQKCVRTIDIDDIGDNTHATFFEMLGNWSLGDPNADDRIGAGYFKEDAIKWSYKLLTNKGEGFGLDPTRLYVTVFEGDVNAPKDAEAFEIWRKYVPENRIYFMGAKTNWWSVGDNGPCGPDTEMFYDTTPEGLGDLTKEEYVEADRAQKVVEIWNDVFMEYEKKNGAVVGKLKQKNVDTGAGLERLAMVLQKKDNIFDTDLFAPIMTKIKSVAVGRLQETSARIVADHVRTAVFMLADWVVPSNTDRGYVLRRLIRRAVWHGKKLCITSSQFAEIISAIAKKYEPTHSSILQNYKMIAEEFLKEVERFEKALGPAADRAVEKELQNIFHINAGGMIDEKGLIAHAVFNLVTTHGLPFELVKELAKERGLVVDEVVFERLMSEHKNLSRVGAGQKFVGGLADHKEETVRLHTAHHLLLAALQKVLGGEVHQRGSNITSERLRIDFSFDRKMTPEEIKQVEDLVNEKIEERLAVVRKDMKKEEAEKMGAEMEFGVKYGDIVSVYCVQERDDTYFSKEFCGGPHVANTGELGQLGHSVTKFKITKEEAVAAGIRRIKAVLR